MKKLDFILILSLSLLLQSCGGCSRDARLINVEREADKQAKSAASASARSEKQNSDDSPRRGSRVVKMTKSGGVYLVPIEVNGVQMEFIFDTGASSICISLTEAQFLYKQGKLTQEDILGSEHYRIADGTIVEGTKIILRKVRVGNKTLTNVEASVMHNLSAPLLLGQSALARFGKISIDYNKGEIEFE